MSANRSTNRFPVFSSISLRGPSGVKHITSMATSIDSISLCSLAGVEFRQSKTNLMISGGGCRVGGGLPSRKNPIVLTALYTVHP